MRCSCRSLLPLFLFVLFCKYINSCKNFLVQNCVDISIGFNSISTIKCIQLIPAQFDLSIDYSVENYIIQKSETCYNIGLYNSSSINLFSNECSEICPEQYCLLFDNQPNTSIINVFYSPSSIYELIQSITNDTLSYDYFLFDTCSSTDRTNRILLIIVYLLCAIIVILTIAVILKFIISKKLRGNPSRPYRPYDWRWILDCIFCQIQRNNKQMNKRERNSNDSDSVENSNQSGTNRLNQRNNLVTTSTQAFMISSSSPNTTNDRRNYGNSSSGNSSYQRDHGLIFENNIPISNLSNNAEYIEYEDTNSLAETENHNQQPVLASLQRLSQKVSSALSVKSTTVPYTQLAATPSPDIIMTRL
jgi:hypothetical protein